MDLLKYITDVNVMVPMKARDKNAVIAELVDFLVEKNHLPAELREQALSALMAREESMSTGMEHGTALPHATVEFTEKLICAVGIHPSGVEFDSPDRSETRIIILMLIPKRKFSEHVRTIADISRVLSNEKLREHLKKAASPKEAVSIIRMHTARPA